MKEISKIQVIRNEAGHTLAVMAVLLIAAMSLFFAADSYAAVGVNPGGISVTGGAVNIPIPMPVAPTGVSTGCGVGTTSITNVVTGIQNGGLQGVGAGFNPVCSILLDIDYMLTGTTGKAIATVALLALGLGALFGKITWNQALVVCLGVGLLFGAVTIIGDLGKATTGATMFSNDSATINLSGINVSQIDPIATVLDILIASMTGEGGRAVGVIGVVILAVGALFGKISWQQALVLSAGVGLVFGCVGLVGHFWNLRDPGSYVTMSQSIHDPVGAAFMGVVNYMISEIGISIATVAVMALGFAAMMGKVTWVRAIILAVGIALVFGAADVLYILSGPFANCAFTTSSDPFTQVLCGFLGEMQSPIGKTIGTLAVMIVGVMAMLGKVSWELGLIVIIGIALVFGAQSLVDLFETNIAGVTCNSAAPDVPNTGNAIGDVLCYIIRILYGPAGKALATIAVVMMGFGALMGKVSYGQAFIVAAGIAVTFGAPQIVNIIMPLASTGGCTIPGLNNGLTNILNNIGGLAGVGVNIQSNC